MFKKEYLAKMLVVFGAATLITWVVSFISMLIPYQFKVAKWVYLFSQEVSEKSIFPLIGILAIIGGVYICNSAKKESGESKCRCALWAERLSSILCLFLFALLVSVTIMYCFSIKTLKADIKSQIMGEANKVKAQISMMVQTNPQLAQGNLQKGLQELDKRVNDELKKAKRDIILNSVKILVGLISYAITYLIFAIYLFKLSLKKECES